MIPDVQPNILRPANMELSIAGGIRLNNEQGRLLGLRSEQTVRGVVDESGTRIMLTNEHSSLQLALPGRFQSFTELMFRSWVTPRGFMLQLLTQPGKQDVKTAPIPSAAPATGTAAGPPLPARATFLFQLQTPLSALAAFTNPQALRQLIASAVNTTSNPVELDAIWQQRLGISATTIKSALLHSGLLGLSTVSGNTTLKSLLEHLKKRLEDSKTTAPGMRVEDIAEAIDYLESSQLHGIAKQEVNEMLYRFPVLFTDTPPTEVRILREKQQEEAAPESPWRCDLDVPVDNKQSIEISVQLSTDRSLNVVIWSRSAHLVKLMEEELSGLARQLSTWDIALDKCQIVYGERPGTQQGTDASQRPTGKHLDCYT